MYRCERCGGSFHVFATPGQCPLCKGWARVRCHGCGHTDHADRFVANKDRCPKCGSLVDLSGGGDPIIDAWAWRGIRGGAVAGGLLAVIVSVASIWREGMSLGVVLALVVLVPIFAVFGAIIGYWVGGFVGVVVSGFYQQFPRKKP